MLKYALMVFFVGALGGLLLASFVLRGRFAPWVVSLLHALLGASGLTLLVLAVLDGQGGVVAMVSLGVLVVTACFGFYLATLHMSQKLAVKRIVLAHAGFAVTGVSLLIVALMRS